MTDVKELQDAELNGVAGGAGITSGRDSRENQTLMALDSDRKYGVIAGLNDALKFHHEV